jgi:mannose/fructose/N-acetylgalactosamine-specific phosphotransferase system component IIB
VLLAVTEYIVLADVLMLVAFVVAALLCSKSDGSGVFTVIKQVIQVMLVVAGIIAVIMIIVGGIKYTTSNGDQAHVKSAKDTILYSVIGLVVAIISYAIVTYVVTNIK